MLSFELALCSWATFAKHECTSLQQQPLLFGVPKAQTALLDTRGMWKDSFKATSCASSYCFTEPAIFLGAALHCNWCYQALLMSHAHHRTC